MVRNQLFAMVALNIPLPSLKAFEKLKTIINKIPIAANANPINVVQVNFFMIEMLSVRITTNENIARRSRFGRGFRA